MVNKTILWGAWIAALFLCLQCSAQPQIKSSGVKVQPSANSEDNNPTPEETDAGDGTVQDPSSQGDPTGVEGAAAPETADPEVKASSYHLLAKAQSKIWSIKVIDKTTGRLVLSGGGDWDDATVKGVNEGFVGFSTDWGKTINYVTPSDPTWSMLTGWLFNVDCLNDTECWTAGRWCGVFYTSDFGKTWKRSHLNSPDIHYCDGGGRFTYGVVARSGTVMVSGTDANIFRLQEGSKTEFWESKNPGINQAMFNLNCVDDEFCFSAARKAFMKVPFKPDPSKIHGEGMSATYFRGSFACEGDQPASFNDNVSMIADWSMDPKPQANYCSLKKQLSDNKCYDTTQPDPAACATLFSQVDEGFDHGHSIYATSFLNKNLGYVLNADGTIGKTVDGGATFKVSVRAKKRLESISVVSEKIAYAGGADGTLLKTSDGGLTWAQDSLWPTDLKATITAVHFVDENHGYVGMFDGTLVYFGPD